jgi:hypothetical protein
MTGLAEEPSLTKRGRGIDAQRSALRDRRGHFLSLHDFSVGHGLEIGPLDAGIADPGQDSVSYVDVFDAEGTREHYADDPNVILELIPDIDFPLYLNGSIRTLAEAASPGAPYDWVIASHVIEHVPDVIGWLGEIAELTADGGALLLAVPDRRYCFDRHRPPTTTGQAIEAHEAGHTRPSLRAVYDYFSSAVAVDTVALWEGARPPGRSARMHDLASVQAALDRCRAGEYVDCHVWTYTPDSLLDQIRELRDLGLCDWYVERLVPVPRSVEFHVVLRRLPRRRESNAPPVPEPEPVSGDLPDWLFEEWSAQDTVRRLRGRVRKLRRRNRALRASLEDLRGSRRMQIGSAILAPLRMLRTALRRRR